MRPISHRALPSIATYRLPPSTPFPSFLIDFVMPTLTDTQWRVLCVVVRQTLGWHAGSGQRRRLDWLTHRQLQLRTGRASEAVCRAIDGLCRRDLVTVWNDRFQPLTTAQARRRQRGKLFYGLSAALVDKSGELLRPPNDYVGNRNSEIENNNIKRYENIE